MGFASMRKASKAKAPPDETKRLRVPKAERKSLEGIHDSLIQSYDAALRAMEIGLPLEGRLAAHAAAFAGIVELGGRHERLQNCALDRAADARGELRIGRR